MGGLSVSFYSKKGTATKCFFNVFDNDDPAHFATVHSAHLTESLSKMLRNILPTVTLTLTTP